MTGARRGAGRGAEDADWPSPTALPDLAAGVVHLWRIPLIRERGAIEACARLLSDDERARMQRFHFDVHRERFALRRGSLRILLGRYLGLDPARVEFRYSPRGKPEVGERLAFNLSDSSDWALLGVTLRAEDEAHRGREGPLSRPTPGERGSSDANRIGVDIEEMRVHSDLEGIARRYFSPREREAFGSLAPSESIAGFYNAWTRKEAWLKACGDGLFVPLSDFDVSLAPGEPPRLLRVRDEPAPPRGWSLHAVDPAPGYVGAVAIDREQVLLSTWTYAPGSEPPP